MSALRHRAAAGMLLATMLVSRAAAAQVLLPQPPGPYVLDIRGTTLGVPQTSNFYPAIPSQTIIPARGFGLDAGAHVYPFPLGAFRVGLGIAVIVTRATAQTPPASSDSTGTGFDLEPETFPDVKVSQRLIAPQVSLNFGTSRGWSYLSGGVGRAHVESTADAMTLATSRLSINAGAGARWFVRQHFGVGFDLRAHWLGSRAVIAASAGFSVK